MFDIYSCTISKIRKILTLSFFPYFSKWRIAPLHLKKLLSQLQFMLHLSVRDPPKYC